jgi:hypothetical protein
LTSLPRPSVEFLVDHADIVIGIALTLAVDKPIIVLAKRRLAIVS